MRWGVGKGKFRNLSAIVFCFLLAGVFYVVWTFFQSIKPLTVDTSPQASTALISDRLINTNNDDTTTTLRISDVELFALIADSVNSQVSAELVTEQHATKQFEEADLLRILISLQEQSRKTVGLMLNETYTSSRQYKNITNKILSRVLTQNHDVEYPLVKLLRKHPAVVQAHQTVHNNVKDIELTKHEIEIIDEFLPKIRNYIFPFEIGLCSDSVKYIEYKQQLQTGVKP